VYQKKFNSFKQRLNGTEGRDEGYTYKSVCIVNGKPQVLHGFDCRNQVAVGRFRNSINETGWSYLEIETKEGYDAELQAYAAGILEGTLTQQLIEYHIHNTINDYCKGFKGYCGRLNEYLRQNLKYIEERISRAPQDDPYWQSVKRAYLQLTGVLHGYQGSSFNQTILFTIHPIFMINTNGGELYDLEKKFNKTKDPIDAADEGHCSGLIKIAPNNSDIFISQVTMSGLQNMLRILKLYKFGYDKHMTAGHTNTFSSYPGMLYSSDDFALTSAGLAVIETTISVFNNKLFEKVVPEGQLHCWVRAVVANQLARTGREWCEIFRRHNSGTYNNQWIVLDYKQFTPHAELPNYGLLYVLEQMPGYVLFRDVTAFLKEHTYYASYNIPFFKKITEMSGFDKKAQELYWFSWKDCPRAKIFRRDHSKVVDLDSLTRLMRYNDYKNEPFSQCECNPPYTAEAAISARGDLNPPNGTYPLPGMGHVNHAALDYKGTNYELFKQLRFRAWSGPTYDNVPVFKWSTFDMASKIKHAGHPDVWAFKPLEYKWETQGVSPSLK
jgi:hypothetical protein